MEIIGIGIDLVEITRMERAIARHDEFVSRIFSPRERARCGDCTRPGRRYAACFAAKEAASKALGTGIRGFGLQELEVLEDETGRPAMVLSGKALDVARGRGVARILISISHSREMATAIAQAIGEGQACG
jgi:holo-[acyl-carrier protein] synthase